MLDNVLLKNIDLSAFEGNYKDAKSFHHRAKQFSLEFFLNHLMQVKFFPYVTK